MASRASRPAALAVARPQPPAALLGAWPHAFAPAPELTAWALGTFVEEGGALVNPDHEHLREAVIGMLWTNVPNSRHMRNILATAEIPQTQGGAWKRGRADQQLRDWFGVEPEFLITVYAPDVAQLDDVGLCALIEHELYHCAQAKDEYGAPRYTRDGMPIWGILGHDVEEFVGVVRRYGAGAGAGATAALVRAAAAAPEIGRAAVAGACGTCALRVA